MGIAIRGAAVVAYLAQANGRQNLMIYQIITCYMFRSLGFAVTTGIFLQKFVLPESGSAATVAALTTLLCLQAFHHEHQF